MTNRVHRSTFKEWGEVQLGRRIKNNLVVDAGSEVHLMDIMLEPLDLACD